MRDQCRQWPFDVVRPRHFAFPCGPFVKFACELQFREGANSYVERETDKWARAGWAVRL